MMPLQNRSRRREEQQKVNDVEFRWLQWVCAGLDGFASSMLSLYFF